MSSTLAANAGSLDRLKVRMRWGCRRCASQIRCTALRLMPTAFGDHAAGPMRGRLGRLAAWQREHLGDGGGCKRGPTRLARLVSHKAVDAFLGEALLPTPHRGSAHVASDARPRRRTVGPPKAERSWLAERASEDDC